MHYQCEYQKSSRFSKTTSLHMQYTWCLCHHCKNMTWKFRLEGLPFMEDVNNPGQNFLSFFWTWIWFLRIQLQESCLHFYFDKVKFSRHSHSWILRFLLWMCCFKINVFLVDHVTSPLSIVDPKTLWAGSLFFPLLT